MKIRARLEVFTVLAVTLAAWVSAVSSASGLTRAAAIALWG